MSASRLLVLLRPYIWLLVAAFAAGFLSYVTLGGSPATPRMRMAASTPLASAPSSDDWNLPKHI